MGEIDTMYIQQRYCFELGVAGESESRMQVVRRQTKGQGPHTGRDSGKLGPATSTEKGDDSTRILGMESDLKFKHSARTNREKKKKKKRKSREIMC